MPFLFSIIFHKNQINMDKKLGTAIKVLDLGAKQGWHDGTSLYKE